MKAFGIILATMLCVCSLFGLTATIALSAGVVPVILMATITICSGYILWSEVRER